MVQLEHTRRSIVRAGAWSVPAIAVASTAPAFAASTGIRGTHQATERTATTFRTTGTCTNDTASAVVVTLTHNWRCDDSGQGAGTFVDFYQNGNYPNGWTIQSTGWYSNGVGATGGFIATWRRTVTSGATVPLPDVLAQVNTAAQTGDQTTTFSAPAGVAVTQPAPLRWSAFAGAAAGARSRAPQYGQSLIAR